METKIVKHTNNTIIKNIQWKKMIKTVECPEAYKYTDKDAPPSFSKLSLIINLLLESSHPLNRKLHKEYL
jgi:hypothetical protein